VSEQKLRAERNDYNVRLFRGPVQVGAIYRSELEHDVTDADFARAESFCRAVNSHDELVEALQEVVNWLQFNGSAANARGSTAIGVICKSALAKASGGEG